MTGPASGTSAHTGWFLSGYTRNGGTTSFRYRTCSPRLEKRQIPAWEKHSGLRGPPDRTSNAIAKVVRMRIILIRTIWQEKSFPVP